MADTKISNLTAATDLVSAEMAGQQGGVSKRFGKALWDAIYQPLASALTSWASVVRAAGFDTFVATPSSANLRTLLTDETGTGAAVFANTPTLVTPVLGAATGTSLNLSGLTASNAVHTDGSKNLVSVANTGSGNNVLATSPSLTTPTLGVASATTINKVTITAPATAATLTIPDGVTLTGPAASGTAMTLGNTETVTGVKTFGSAGAVGRLKLAGTTSGTTVLDASATASGTLTLPAATDTLVGKATTDTLTNKTYDTAGTGNSFSINGLAATANTGTGSVVRATSPALVTPDIGAATGTSLTTTGTVASSSSSNTASIATSASAATLALDATGASGHSWRILTGASNFKIIDDTGGVTPVTITNANVFQFSGIPSLVGGAISFPATQVSSAGANDLDDYEENTWTPTFTFSGGNTGITYTTQSGRYTKIGRMVLAQGRVTLSNKGSSTGQARITNLPFTCSATHGPGSVGFAAGFTGLTGAFTAYVEASNTFIVLAQTTSTGVSLITDTACTNTTDIIFSVAYQV